MGFLKFDFGDIKQAVETKIDEIKQQARDVLAEYFGDKFVKQDISGEGSALRNRDDASTNMMRKVGDKRKFIRIANIYEEMWHDRYEFFQQQQRNNISVRRPSAHQRYKSEHMGEPAYHNSSNISYEQVTLWTGFFRDVISDAFKAGGNEVLEITNILFVAGFSMNMDKLPRGAGGKNFYREVFTPWFEDEVGLPHPTDERFMFDPDKIGRVMGLMVEMFREGPVEQIVDIIRDIEWKI